MSHDNSSQSEMIQRQNDNDKINNIVSQNVHFNSCSIETFNAIHLILVMGKTMQRMKIEVLGNLSVGKAFFVLKGDIFLGVLITLCFLMLLYKIKKETMKKNT